MPDKVIIVINSDHFLTETTRKTESIPGAAIGSAIIMISDTLFLHTNRGMKNLRLGLVLNFTIKSKKNNDPILTFSLTSRNSPHVRESRTFFDSGFHAVDSGFQHSGFRIPKSAGFQ